MKVGIMTFHRAINYGAVLQSLALKETINSLGHSCEIINYQCDTLEKVASPFYIESRSIKSFLIFLLQIKMRCIKNKRFDTFACKFLDKDKAIVSNNNINEATCDFDVLVTGSDQVWNYEITGLDKNFFLDFGNENQTRISYAASFGVSSIPDNLVPTYKQLLQKLDSISVREEQGANLVRALVNKNCTMNIDPVFLFDKERWKQYITMNKPETDYIVVYCINKSECYKVAEKLSHKTGLKIVGLQVSMSNRTKCKKIQTESPEDFLGWIYRAKYVVTDSFHGTAFSLIFNKQFIVCTGGMTKQRMSRQETLLKIFGLTSRIYTNGDYSVIFEPIDYEGVNRLIAISREESKVYLKKAIIRKVN